MSLINTDTIKDSIPQASVNAVAMTKPIPEELFNNPNVTDADGSPLRRDSTRMRINYYAQGKPTTTFGDPRGWTRPMYFSWTDPNAKTTVPPSAVVTNTGVAGGVMYNAKILAEANNPTSGNTGILGNVKITTKPVIEKPANNDNSPWNDIDPDLFKTDPDKVRPQFPILVGNKGTTTGNPNEQNKSTEAPKTEAPKTDAPKTLAANETEKPIYKQWWAWLIIVLLIAALVYWFKFRG